MSVLEKVILAEKKSKDDLEQAMKDIDLMYEKARLEADKENNTYKGVIDKKIETIEKDTLKEIKGIELSFDKDMKELEDNYKASVKKNIPKALSAVIKMVSDL